MNSKIVKLFAVSVVLGGLILAFTIVTSTQLEAPVKWQTVYEDDAGLFCLSPKGDCAIVTPPKK